MMLISNTVKFQERLCQPQPKHMQKRLFKRCKIIKNKRHKKYAQNTNFFVNENLSGAIMPFQSLLTPLQKETQYHR